MNDNHEKYSLSGKHTEVKGDDLKEKDVKATDKERDVMGEKQDKAPGQKGGAMKEKDGSGSGVIMPALSYHQLQTVVDEANDWYRVASKILFMWDGNHIADYLVFRLWCLKYEVYKGKNTEIYDNYRDAFKLEYAEEVKHFEDQPVVIDILFLAWFAKGHRCRPPQSRAWLLKHARKWRNLLLYGE